MGRKDKKGAKGRYALHAPHHPQPQPHSTTHSDYPLALRLQSVVTACGPQFPFFTAPAAPQTDELDSQNYDVWRRLSGSESSFHEAVVHHESAQIITALALISGSPATLNFAVPRDSTFVQGTFRQKFAGESQQRTLV